MNLKSALLTLATATALFPVAAVDLRDGLVRISVGTFREAPAQSAELATQAGMGTPLKINSRCGEWLQATTPDGYNAWINESGVQLLDSTEMHRWRSAKRMMVSTPQQIYVMSDTSNISATHRICDLVTGNIVEIHNNDTQSGQWTMIRIPDGRYGYVKTSYLTPLTEIADRIPNSSRIVEFATTLLGTPYLWGGTSIKMIDCSGLTYLSYFMEGLILPRNTSAQAETGQSVSSPKEGDILVFTNPNTGKVNHVGIYMTDSLFIHASGLVKINSLDSKSPQFSGKLHKDTRRIISNTSGTQRIKTHNGYFNN